MSAMKTVLMEICETLEIDEPYDKDGNLDPRIQAKYDEGERLAAIMRDTPAARHQARVHETSLQQ